MAANYSSRISLVDPVSEFPRGETLRVSLNVRS